MIEDNSRIVEEQNNSTQEENDHLSPERVICIRKNGHWYFGEAEMFRRNILNMLAQGICKEEDGSYVIRLGEEESPIACEDAPFFAHGILVEDGKIKLVFYDLQEMYLVDEMKVHFKGDIPYLTYKWEGDTKLSKGVYWKLFDFMDIRGDDVYLVPPENCESLYTPLEGE